MATHVASEGDGLAPIRYLIRCPFCQGQFDLFAAAWCGHRDNQPSKICPRCACCLCDHPAYDQPALWKEAPPVFQRRGFRRLSVLYL